MLYYNKKDGDFMWEIISNISAIVTCLTFLLYLSGRIWVVYKNRYTLYEDFEVIPYGSNADIENEDNVLIVDSEGCEFTIKSNFGIETIKVYKLNYDSGMNKIISRDLVNSFENLNRAKLFVRCDLGEILPTTQIEIQRNDYTIITFDIYESGKNGHLITDNYKFKLTFKGMLYHLCA